MFRPWDLWDVDIIIEPHGPTWLDTGNCSKPQRPFLSFKPIVIREREKGKTTNLRVPVWVGPLEFGPIPLFKAGPTPKLNSVWKIALVAQRWALPRMEILRPLWAVCSNAALSELNLEAIHHITTTSGSTFLTAFLMQSVCWHVGCSKYQ